MKGNNINIKELVQKQENCGHANTKRIPFDDETPDKGIVCTDCGKLLDVIKPNPAG